MANQKISQLTPTGSPGLTDEIVLVQGGVNKKAELGDLPIPTSVQTALDGKQGSITLTTTGSSGPATLVGNTLNIPKYSGGGGGGGDMYQSVYDPAGIEEQVVGTTATQTLTNKTISGADNTLTNIAQSSVTNLTTDLAGKVSTIGAQTIAGTKTFSSTIAGTIDATNALKSATTTINVSSATAPTTGQVLTATSSTTATWQTPSGGSGKTKLIDLAFAGEFVGGSLVPKTPTPGAGTFNWLTISSDTLPTGSNITIDVKKNGTSILSAPLSITTTESTTSGIYSVTTGDVGKATITTTTFSAKDRLEVIGVAGSTLPGTNVTVQLIATLT